MSSDDPVDVDNAFTEKYRRTLQAIKESGECPAPFCKEVGNNHEHPTLLSWGYWKVTLNSFNYQNSKYPFLLILKEHVEEFSKVSPEAWSELQRLINHLVETYKLKGYTLLWRLGESSHTGASVKHLHAHLICGYKKPKNPSSEDTIFALVGFA
jgi:ATP adenylyltransferase